MGKIISWAQCNCMKGSDLDPQLPHCQSVLQPTVPCPASLRAASKSSGDAGDGCYVACVSLKHLETSIIDVLKSIPRPVGGDHRQLLSGGIRADAIQWHWHDKPLTLLCTAITSLTKSKCTSAGMAGQSASVSIFVTDGLSISRGKARAARGRQRAPNEAVMAD